MKKKQTKAVKKSGSKAASIAGQWLNLTTVQKVNAMAACLFGMMLGKKTGIVTLIDKIDTMAASVLSQTEGKK